MHAALRKWVLVALSLFNLLANVALLNSSFSCPRGPMNQLGIDARGVVYVLKYVVGAKNLRLAFARLVDKVSALDLSINHALVFCGGILLVAALYNLATSSGNSRKQQQLDSQITLHLTSNVKSKSARCTLLCGFDELDPVRTGRVELHRGDAIDVLSFTYQHQERALYADTSSREHQQYEDDNENLSS